MKIKLTILIAVLLLTLSGFSMSDDSNEEPKSKITADVQVEQKSNPDFITKEELHRIAINFYKYMFEEEHEWKGMKRKKGEKIIRNIIPYKADDLILEYMVNYNPDGHVLIVANKNLGNPIGSNGSGRDEKGLNDGFMSVHDTKLHPIMADHYYRMLKAYNQKEITTTDLGKSWWKKLNVPIDIFDKRYDFDDWAIPPKWWIEKKKLKNTPGE